MCANADQVDFKYAKHLYNHPFLLSWVTLIISYILFKQRQRYNDALLGSNIAFAARKDGPGLCPARDSFGQHASPGRDSVVVVVDIFIDLKHNIRSENEKMEIADAMVGRRKGTVRAIKTPSCGGQSSENEEGCCR